MSNKSTQFAQNTSIAKQNLRNGKTIDYEKNLAEFRNVISYIDAQLKEGKDNPLIIKTCQNLIRTISGLDLPADVKRHELAVAPSGVQKLYQQMGQSKNGNSGSSKLRQEAMHNAIQQSLRDQIANLHNMSKAERMEFYKRIMTAESLQEAINNGFIVNDEYANALLDKAEADLQRLEYLKNQIAELEEKERNGTITSEERVRLQQCRAELPKAEEDLKNTVEATEVASRHYQGEDPVVQQGLNDCQKGITFMFLNGDTNGTNLDDFFIRFAQQTTEPNLTGGIRANGLVDIDQNNSGFDFNNKLAREAMENNRNRTITGVSLTNDNVQVDVSSEINAFRRMVDDTENVTIPNFLDKAINNSDSEQYVPTGTSTYTTIFNTTSKELYTIPNFGDMVTLSSAQKNEFTEENNIIVGGREEPFAKFVNRTDVNAKEVLNLNTAGYEFNNIPQTSSANEPAAGLDEVEKAVKIAKLEEKVKNGLVTQEERQELEQVQLEMVKANQEANENKYISSFIQVNTQPEPVKTDENTEEHNKPIQNNEADVQAFIQNNASFGLEEAIITTAKMDDKAKSLKQSDFLNQIDTLVLSSCAKVIKEKSDINKVVSNATAKPNKATEPKKESSLNKTLASNTEQKNDFAPNTTTQTSDITENKNDIFNQSFAPTTDVTSYDVSTNFTLSDSSGQQGSSLTGALSAASYNPYEPMMPSFGNAR